MLWAHTSLGDTDAHAVGHTREGQNTLRLYPLSAVCQLQLDTARS